MADLNQVVLVGRLTRNAELKYTTSGKAVATFSLAVNEKRKEGDHWKDKADFFELVLWGQLAESLEQYLLKGKQIGVIGKLAQERWEQDGQNRSKVTVIVQTIQLLSGNNSDSGPKQESLFSSDDGYVDEVPF